MVLILLTYQKQFFFDNYVTKLISIQFKNVLFSNCVQKQSHKSIISDELFMVNVIAHT